MSGKKAADDLLDELASSSIHAGDPDAVRARVLGRRLREAAHALDAAWTTEPQREAARAFVRRAAKAFVEVDGRAEEAREHLLELCRRSGAILRGWARTELWANQGGQALDTSVQVVASKFGSLYPEVVLNELQLVAIRALLAASAENRGGGGGKKAQAPNKTRDARERLLQAMGWPAMAETAARTARRRRARQPSGQ